MTTIDSEPPAVAPMTVEDIAGKILRQSAEAARTNEQFFFQNARRIAQCAGAMAKAFDAGAHLYAMGNGGSCCDALHMAVEWTHPIFEKRPAMPAISLTTDMAHITAVGNDQDFSLAYVQQLKILARPGDIAIGFSTSGKSANVVRALQAAKEMGALSIGIAGRDGGRMPPVCDFCFVVPSFSIPRIQEVHEILLHVLWDMVHVIRGEEDVL